MCMCPWDENARQGTDIYMYIYILQSYFIIKTWYNVNNIIVLRNALCTDWGLHLRSTLWFRF